MLEIKFSINDFTFFTITVDETTGAATKSRLSRVIRYIKMDGNIEYKFWWFKNVSNDRDRTSNACLLYTSRCV